MDWGVVGQLSRSGRIISVGVGVTAGLGALALVGTVYAMARVARAVVTPATKRKQDQRVLAVDPERGEVTLMSTPDTRVPGLFGLWGVNDSAYVRVGEIVRTGDSTVTRRIEEHVFGELSPGAARWSGWYYLGPEELGYPVRTVELDSTLGQSPAWVIPAAPADGTAHDSRGGDSPWVIQVHGRGAERQEALRAVPVFRESGYTSLIISYRNDGTAPESADRRYGLGGTEWLDLEAGIRYALAEGATSIVLMGWSMGGAIVLQAVTRSPSLEKVTGLVLESPVVDWIDTLEYQARILHIPGPIAQGARRMIESPWGTGITGLDAAIDLTGLDFVSRALDLSRPTLILHSDDDGYVPSTASRALAEARPDIVTLVPFSVAKHTRLWNYDRERWNEAIRSWLTRL
jgi:alpha-beta hydrolase superfamily lysophospholipase